MEEMNRTHKEPAWGWIGALVAALPPRAERRAPTPRQVVTPWSPRSAPGWSA
ncbi:hypothetical protein [Brevundimonas sp.]|jgi:hypothetical protein|uniref:hypothetical protein n=1 Tax=Brevundimonas sp. TaxID=1871086 RepID=UPI003784F9B2